MGREPQDDDVLIFPEHYDYHWCYRHEYVASVMGDFEETLFTETPEWVDFMENEV
ncbi:hypothetical protein vBAspALolek_35 [Aeromonas phage vB_AspA_Lolek]|nr:hypothetical protein vBAspALolek_35 [Aeromonas phage vB_AspA_Lolek]